MGKADINLQRPDRKQPDADDGKQAANNPAGGQETVPAARLVSA